MARNEADYHMEGGVWVCGDAVFALFLVRFCCNFYFKSLYCGFKALSNLVPRVSHLTAWSEQGETLAHAGHVPL